jgi:hypothetical protein
MLKLILVCLLLNLVINDVKKTEIESLEGRFKDDNKLALDNPTKIENTNPKDQYFFYSYDSETDKIQQGSLNLIVMPQEDQICTIYYDFYRCDTTKTSYNQKPDEKVNCSSSKGARGIRKKISIILKEEKKVYYGIACEKGTAVVTLKFEMVLKQ